MPSCRKRIAILLYEAEAYVAPYEYFIETLAKTWLEDGHEVLTLFGINSYIPADVLIVHVNLSVVPEEYLEFARKYPVVLNGRMADIRKSGFSRNRVLREDGYAGPVIVKSDLNSAGASERWLGVPGQSESIEFSGAQSYQIFEHPLLIPSAWFNDPYLFIERFQPEMDGGLYTVRLYEFLGSQVHSMQFWSPDPIVFGGTAIRSEWTAPHPDLAVIRQGLNMEYGKLDYVVQDGRAVLLDVNKTTGTAVATSDEKIIESRRVMARGLYEYF